MISRLRDAPRKNAAGLVPADLEKEREMNSRDWAIDLSPPLVVTSIVASAEFNSSEVMNVLKISEKIKGKLLRARVRDLQHLRNLSV